MPTERPTVTLPDGEDIPILDFTRRIAESLLPDLKDCSGLTCVVGIKKQTAAGLFPFKLSKADIASLEPLFADLPKVHACMSDEELVHFLSAYEAHPNKPEGTPYFVSESDIQRRQAEIESLDDVHRQAIREKIRAGEMKVYDQNHCPAKALGFNVFMSRSSAMQYLASINLKLADLDLQDTNNVSEIVASSIEREGEPLQVDRTGALVPPPNAAVASPYPPRVKHSSETDAPHIPPKTNDIGRIAMKAAWIIGKELERRATSNEVMGKLGEWYKNKSPLAEGIIHKFDEEKMTLWWITPKYPSGKIYMLKGCGRHIDIWCVFQPKQPVIPIQTHHLF